MLCRFGPGVKRVHGSFFFSPDLRRFPFDTQTLPIVLEEKEHSIKDFIFVTDKNCESMPSAVLL